MGRGLIVGLVLALAVVGGVVAARPWASDASDQSSVLLGGFDFQTPVEQQTAGGATQPDRDLWVVNPFVPDRAWDADDHYGRQTVDPAQLPGEVVSETVGIVGDATDHVIRVRFQGQNGRTFGWTVTATPGPDGSPALVLSGTFQQAKTVCLIGAKYQRPLDSNPLLSPIPVSNGGVGVLVDVTGSVTTDKRSKDTTVTAEVQPNTHPFHTRELCGGHPATTPELWQTAGGCCGHEPQWWWREVD